MRFERDEQLAAVAAADVEDRVARRGRHEVDRVLELAPLRLLERVELVAAAVAGAQQLGALEARGRLEERARVGAVGAVEVASSACCGMS